MKRQMIYIMIIFILMTCLVEATVEDSGAASGDVSSSTWTDPDIANFAWISAQPLFR